MFFGSKESILWTPSETNAAINHCVINAKMFTQFCNATGNSSDRNNYVVSPVAMLFRWCRPTAIGRLIISVIVNAINRFTNWAFPHVFQKMFNFKPSFTDFNSSAPIIFIGIMLWIGAAIYHAVPALVGIGFGKSMSSEPAIQATIANTTPQRSIADNFLSTANTSTKTSVGSISSAFSRKSLNDGVFPKDLSHERFSFPRTATGLFGSRSQGASSCNNDLSTITQAFVLAVFFPAIDSWVGITDHQKLAEPLVNQRRSFLWHNNKCKLLCFRGGPWDRYQGPLLYYETGGAIYQG